MTIYNNVKASGLDPFGHSVFEAAFKYQVKELNYGDNWMFALRYVMATFIHNEQADISLTSNIGNKSATQVDSDFDEVVQHDAVFVDLYHSNTDFYFHQVRDDRLFDDRVGYPSPGLFFDDIDLRKYLDLCVRMNFNKEEIRIRVSPKNAADPSDKFDTESYWSDTDLDGRDDADDDWDYVWRLLFVEDPRKLAASKTESAPPSTNEKEVKLLDVFKDVALHANAVLVNDEIWTLSLSAINDYLRVHNAEAPESGPKNLFETAMLYFGQSTLRPETALATGLNADDYTLAKCVEYRYSEISTLEPVGDIVRPVLDRNFQVLGNYKASEFYHKFGSTQWPHMKFAESANYDRSFESLSLFHYDEDAGRFSTENKMRAACEYFRLRKQNNALPDRFDNKITKDAIDFEKYTRPCVTFRTKFSDLYLANAFLYRVWMLSDNDQVHKSDIVEIILMEVSDEDMYYMRLVLDTWKDRPIRDILFNIRPSTSEFRHNVSTLKSMAACIHDEGKNTTHWRSTRNKLELSYPFFPAKDSIKVVPNREKYFGELAKRVFDAEGRFRQDGMIERVSVILQDQNLLQKYNDFEARLAREDTFERTEKQKLTLFLELLEPIAGEEEGLVDEEFLRKDESGDGESQKKPRRSNRATTKPVRFGYESGLE